MRKGLIVSNIEDSSLVCGVHGAAGISRWKCLARRNSMYGHWEAIEWAWLPSAGISGNHLHTRTEEVYFIVRGEGEICLNGQVRPVSAGHVILTGVGTTHGLRNVVDEDLSWLVIELLSPATMRVFAGECATTKELPRGTEMKTSAVFNLREEREIDPRTILSGSLRTIRLVTLSPKQRISLSAIDEEHFVFTLSGRGHAIIESTMVPMSYGVSVTLPLGTSVTLSSGEEGMEYFLASIYVPKEMR